MKLLNSLFSNEKMQDAAFGFLRKTMVDGNLKHIIVTIKAEGGFDFQMLKAEDEPVIYSQATVDQMKAAFDQLQTENNRLAQMCKEMEQAITPKTTTDESDPTDEQR